MIMFLKSKGGYVIALVIAILASLLGIHLVTRLDTLTKENQALSQNKKLGSQILTIEKKKTGELSAKVEALNVDYKGAKALLHSKDEYLVHIVRDYEIKLKNLRTAVNVQTKLETQIVTVIKDTVIQDTTVRKISYEDPWFSVHGIIKGDKIALVPSFRNEQEIITHMERTKKRFMLDFFPPKQMVVEVINKNPHCTVHSLKAVVSNPRKKIFGLF